MALAVLQLGDERRLGIRLALVLRRDLLERGAAFLVSIA
jgi:hypothetical protein